MAEVITKIVDHKDSAVEDLHALAKIAGEDKTKFLSVIGDKAATGTEHQWIYEKYRKRKENTEKEGRAIEGKKIDAPIILSNYVTISDDVGSASNTLMQTGNKLNKNVREKWEIKTTKTLLQDAEYTILSHAGKRSGFNSSSTAGDVDNGDLRRSGGLINYIESDNIIAKKTGITVTSGNSGTGKPAIVYASSLGVTKYSTKVDYTTSAAAIAGGSGDADKIPEPASSDYAGSDFSADDLSILAEKIEEHGGDADLILCNRMAHRKIQSFTAQAERRNVDLKDKVRGENITIYVTPSATLDIMSSLSMRKHSEYTAGARTSESVGSAYKGKIVYAMKSAPCLYMMERATVSMAWLRRFKTHNKGIDGDRQVFFINGEYTLEVENPGLVGALVGLKDADDT